MTTQQSPKDLVIFALGPVQSFIETARRVQDLWVGSELLSVLAQAALDEAEQNGAETLFPEKVGGGWPKSIPNRVVLSVAAGGAQTVGRAMAQAAHAKWTKIAEIVRGYFNSMTPTTGWEDLWEKQINHWLETYWIGWRWDGQDATYGNAYRDASLALDARKGIRYFPPWDERDVKCSLCGIRQALRTNLESEEFWTSIRKKLLPADLREGERLCAICTVKRLAGKREAGIRELKTLAYPSTSSIAAAAFRQQILQQWAYLAPAVTEHLNAVDHALGRHARRESPEPISCLIAQASQIGDGNALRFLCYDGDYFYLDFWTEARVKEALGKGRREALSGAERKGMEQARRTLGNLLDLCRKREPAILPPSPYFATLVMDGDRMGKLLSNAKSIEEHRAISRAVSKFSEETAHQIAEREQPGILVYGGGDDLLAFAPTSHALMIADQLRSAFTQVMGSEGHPGCTASAGLVLSHHTQPLESALRAARAAEREAKDEDKLDRNALVVNVLRRSGEPRTLGSRWEYDGMVVIPLFEEIERLIRNGQLSGKFAYDVLEEASGLTELPVPARVNELKRLLSRHRDRAKWPDADFKTASENLATQMAEFAWQSKRDAAEEQIKHLGDWLTLARFLAQGGRE